MAYEGKATSKQLDCLKKMGIKFKRSISKQEAHELISERIKSAKSSGGGVRDHASGFPVLGPPGGVIRDFLGSSAMYDFTGTISEVDIPNFGVVDAWSDDEYDPF